LGTWLFFSLFIFFSVLPANVFAKTDVFGKIYNPYWVDSLLVHKTDSAAISQLKSTVLIKDDNTPVKFALQPLKHSSPTLFYLWFLTALLLIALMLHILFDDFSDSLLKGVWSSKQYYIFLRTNKYDSPVPLAYVFVAKNLILSVIVYLVLEKIQPSVSGMFHPGILIKVMAVILLFSFSRSVIEMIFNWTIGTGVIYKAFTLQQLFIDFIYGLVVLCFCIICIYNPRFYLQNPEVWFGVLLGIYLVFNTFKSYQLLSNIRISYRLHFFLYICTFKILPVLLLAKYLLSNT
jgi:hypothetical protein